MAALFARRSGPAIWLRSPRPRWRCRARSAVVARLALAGLAGLAGQAGQADLADLVLDGLALLVTEGAAGAAPALQRAVHRFRQRG